MLLVFVVTVLLFQAAAPAGALTAVTYAEGKIVPGVSEDILETPSGCVLLIVDGLGAAYVYPDAEGVMLDGSPTQTAHLPRFSALWDQGFRAVDVSLLNPVTDKGHSTIVTGNEKADQEMVGYAGSTLQDVFRDNDFLCFGVMTRGDFSEMRQKCDAIVYDPTNSINDAKMVVDRNDFSERNDKIVTDVTAIMERAAAAAPSYTASKETAERYAGYNRWGIETAAEIAAYMAAHPDQKYFLIVNVGAVDSTGHYRGYYAYLDAVARLDDDVAALAARCREYGAAFVLTADHGMTFESFDKKGGHSSSKYAKEKTSLRIPLFVFAPNVLPAVRDESAAQQDIAPTILSLFEIRKRPQYASGNALPVKKTASLTITDVPGKTLTLIRIENGSEIPVYTPAAPDSAFAVHGLPRGVYIIESGDAGIFGEKQRKTVSLEADTTVSLSRKNTGAADPENTKDAKTAASGKTDANENIMLRLPGGVPAKTAVCLILLLIVNLSGLLVIRKIVRKRD